jgi:regulator of replication initiation timing
MEETVARLTALAEILSEQVGVLQQHMSILQTEADTSREETAGLRTRVADLESVMMRQLAAETPVEKLWDQKKNPSTTKGDVLSRLSRSMRKSSLAG